MLAVLSLLLDEPLPTDVAVVGEVGLEGVIQPPYGSARITDDTLLDLAKANGIRRLLTTQAAARLLRGLQQRRPKRLGGVQVVAVEDMVDVMRAVWPQ